MFSLLTASDAPATNPCSPRMRPQRAEHVRQPPVVRVKRCDPWLARRRRTGVAGGCRAAVCVMSHDDRPRAFGGGGRVVGGPVVDDDDLGRRMRPLAERARDGLADPFGPVVRRDHDGDGNCSRDLLHPGQGTQYPAAAEYQPAMPRASMASSRRWFGRSIISWSVWPGWSRRCRRGTRCTSPT